MPCTHGCWKSSTTRKKRRRRNKTDNVSNLLNVLVLYKWRGWCMRYSICTMHTYIPMSHSYSFSSLIQIHLIEEEKNYSWRMSQILVVFKYYLQFNKIYIDRDNSSRRTTTCCLSVDWVYFVYLIRIGCIDSDDWLIVSRVKKNNSNNDKINTNKNNTGALYYIDIDCIQNFVSFILSYFFFLFLLFLQFLVIAIFSLLV